MSLYDIWKQWGLSLSKKSPHTNLNNARIILSNDPNFKDTIYYDEFLQRVIRRNSPVREWADSDDLEALAHIQSVLGIPRMGREAVTQAVISIAHDNKQNCVQEWMLSLRWDGTQRLETFFSDYFGVAPGDYAHSASKNFWLSIAARAFTPGCKVDNMIVLEGEQGIGKSQALHIVGGGWFTEQHESAKNPKAFAEILQGKLLVEISEMDAFTKSEISQVKQTISCQSDRFRASYARHAADHPRTCVFVGTINHGNWNRDETGARRFWPMACQGEIDLPSIAAMREQLFAEAVSRHFKNEPHWSMPSEETKAEQQARYASDPWMDRIREQVKGEEAVTTSWVLDKLGVTTSGHDTRGSMRVGACLRFMGWARKQRRIDGQPSWVYVKAVTVVTGGDEKSL